MKDPVWLRRNESAVDIHVVGDIADDPSHLRQIVQPPGVGGRLQNRVHLVAVGDQPVNQVGADEPGAAGHEAADDSSPSDFALADGDDWFCTEATIYGGLRLTSS